MKERYIRTHAAPSMPRPSRRRRAVRSARMNGSSWILAASNGTLMLVQAHR